MIVSAVSTVKLSISTPRVKKVGYVDVLGESETVGVEVGGSRGGRRDGSGGDLIMRGKDGGGVVGGPLGGRRGGLVGPTVGI